MKSENVYIMKRNLLFDFFLLINWNESTSKAMIRLKTSILDLENGSERGEFKSWPRLLSLDNIL